MAGEDVKKEIMEHWGEGKKGNGLMDYHSTIEKESNPAIYNNMDGPWKYYVKVNQIEKEKYLMISYICGI